MPFPTTKWDVVDGLKADDTTRRDQALSEIVDIYAAPLLAFAKAEFRGRQQQDYEDMLQGFLLRCWEKNSLALANPAKGKFRSYLITVFKNYVLNCDRDAKAARRCPDAGLVSAEALFEAYGAVMEPLAAETPESVFERVYQHRVFDAALQELEARCEATDQDRRYRLFVARAIEPNRDRPGESPTHAELATRFGYPSANSSVKVFRSARAEFRAILRGLLARGSDSEQEVERECECLLAVRLAE